MPFQPRGWHPCLAGSSEPQELELSQPKERQIMETCPEAGAVWSPPQNTEPGAERGQDAFFLGDREVVAAGTMRDACLTQQSSRPATCPSPGDTSCEQVALTSGQLWAGVEELGGRDCVVQVAQAEGGPSCVSPLPLSLPPGPLMLLSPQTSNRLPSALPAGCPACLR